MSPCQGEGRGFESLPPLMEIKEKVFKLLTKIPKGKVVSYKTLAQKTGIKNPRYIGTIIHTNIDPKKYPCHRVVHSDGTLAAGYAFGGRVVQEKLLKSEGIEIHKGRIVMIKYRYTFSF
jgi:O-6-methylguanine DNA methyltransferase